MRILGLDFGEKNIGVALSDELGWTAQGLDNLSHKSKQENITAIAELVKERQVTEIVVGMPKKLDGSLGKKAQQVISFVEDLKKQVNLPIKVWDERFSSVQAERAMLEADLSRKKRKSRIDRLAAQLILQNYLDANANNKDV
ncbi:MAG: Holliday junction resolvase RuvX [Candidatus Omnitrophica bacterium]|nr:Holliday junction resolvase RuvX [Candidatus Omnitrophota bacterium]